MSKSPSVIARFERSYIGEPNSGCWLWERALSGGYGVLNDRGRQLKAHRLSWEIHNGPITRGQWVLHKCDVPACVNPRHLFLGTHAENVADMIGKKRHAFGERQGAAVITDEIAASILNDPRPLKEIARDVGVSSAVVVKIKHGRGWTHATGGRTDIRKPPRGEQKTFAKLTEGDVRAIRSDARIARLIAADYGICISRVYAIKSRTGWRHVI